MITKEQIVEIISQALKEGQFIVDVAVNPGNKIIITLDDFKGITLDTCAEVSRFVDMSLDREKEDFELEVSSPGLLTPFRVIQQYQKNIGKEIEVLYKSGEKINGTLLSANESKIEVEIEEVIKEQGAKKKIKKTIEIEMDQMKHTKLILSF